METFILRIRRVERRGGRAAESTFFAGNNPVYAALGTFYASVTQGFAYTIVNISGTSATTGGTPTVQGASCSNTVNSVTYTGTALDTLGDGASAEF